MKIKSTLIIALTVITLVSSNCKKKDKDPEPAPTPATPSPLASLSTAAISNITDSTAVSGGEVTSEGTSALTAVGICWDTLPNPTTLKSKTNNGAGTGSYTSNLTGLKVNKKYYVRAYATNGNGTAYGNEISFLTPVYNLWKYSAPASALNGFNCMLSISATSIYAGTNNGIVFSSDTGNTWVSKGLAGSDIYSLTQKNNTLFATLSSPRKLYRSVDNGNTWTDLSGNFPYPIGISGVAVQGNKLIAGTDSSAFISSDDGNSWTRIKNGLPVPTIGWGGGGVFDPASSGSQVYALGSKFVGPGYEVKLYKYDEPNNTWEVKTAFATQTFFNGVKVSGNNIFVAESGSFVSEVIASTDGGNNWNQVTFGSVTNVDACGSVVFIGKTSNNNFSLSQDNGTTWTSVKRLGLPSTTNGKAYVSHNYIWLNTGSAVYKYKYN